MFSLSILTSEKTIFEGEVDSIYVPGMEGYLQILSHHAPIITLLKAGNLIVKSHGKEDHYTLSSGLLEVSNNRAILFADGIANH